MAHHQNQGFHRERRQGLDLSGAQQPSAAVPSSTPTSADATTPSTTPTAALASSTPTSAVVSTTPPTSSDLPTTQPTTSPASSVITTSASSISSSSSASILSSSTISSSSNSNTVSSTGAGTGTSSTSATAQTTGNRQTGAGSNSGASTSFLTEVRSGNSASSTGALASTSTGDSSSGLSNGAVTAISVIGGLAGFAILFWIGVQLLQSKRRKREAAEMEQIDFDPSGGSNNGDALGALGFHRVGSAHSRDNSHAGGFVGGAGRELAEVQYEGEDSRKEREQIYADYMQSVAPPPPGLTRNPTTAGMVYPPTSGADLHRSPTQVGMIYNDGGLQRNGTMASLYPPAEHGYPPYDGGLQRQPTGAGMNWGGAGGQADLTRQPTYGHYEGFEQGPYGGHIQQKSQDSGLGIGNAMYNADHVGYDQTAYPNTNRPSPAYPAQTHSPPRDLYAANYGAGVPGGNRSSDDHDPFGAENGSGLSRSDSVGTARELGQHGQLGLVQH